MVSICALSQGEGLHDSQEASQGDPLRLPFPGEQWGHVGSGAAFEGIAQEALQLEELIKAHLRVEARLLHATPAWSDRLQPEPRWWDLQAAEVFVRE